MSVPVQPPASSPAPPPPGPNGRWMLGGTVLGGGGTLIGTLAFVGAPWWAVTVVAVMTILATFIILALPEQSDHKREIWLEAMRYRDRRKERALRRRERRAQRKWEEREERARRKRKPPASRRPRKAPPGDSGG
ncbi:hypothetical protein [Streptomyces hydrogenans]|uniref:hypothetical protein n=1 Tax=Streptomyces hydrogenans TaxID=1873719 RepID=UPI0033FA8524